MKTHEKTWRDIKGMKRQREKKTWRDMGRHEETWWDKKKHKVAQNDTSRQERT